MINSNEQLKLEFNKLYEENKYLLNELEVLYKRFNEISNKFGAIQIKLENNDVKKLNKGKV